MTPLARLRAWTAGLTPWRKSAPVSTREKGREGEERAERFLRAKGFRILARNWRVPAGEIDLVARDGREIVFVEVKSARDGPVDPIDQMTPHKRRKLTQAAEAYLARSRRRAGAARFDVVLVDFRKSPPEITHLEDAFDATA